MFVQESAGQEVLVLPDWAYRVLAKKGTIEDVVNFGKMRQWFTQEQLVALNAFSSNGLEVLWMGAAGGVVGASGSRRRGTRALSFSWLFPESHHQSQTTNAADKYVREQLSRLEGNQSYTTKIVNEYIIDILKQAPRDAIDLQQSYSVYSSSSKLIVVVLNQGVLSPAIFARREELRLNILRDVVGKLSHYHDLNVVHQTNWFGWYLAELDCKK